VSNGLFPIALDYEQFTNSVPSSYLHIPVVPVTILFCPSSSPRARQFFCDIFG